ncbi:MAG: fibronectin type III domain-containing protein [Deltaproteobacteria bacterium]
MSRHFWRARDREAGFSFVELLVTIIIAGIAFAALVPVFVGAQQVASGEQQRNAALGLAQDKLEKIRGLDYDLIDQDDLTSNSIPNAQFGSTVSWATGGGGTRDYTVTYQVDLLPEGSTEGTESYKQVTITVAWTGNPKPVKPVVLSTMVSKQYAGPQIARFEVGPDNILREETGGWSIVSGPVVLDAYLVSEDILSMNQEAAEEDRGYVEFTITPMAGTAMVSQKVTVPVGSTGAEKGHYTFQWDNSAAPSGVYIFQAVAVAGFGSRTQGMPVSIAFNYYNGAPPPPTGLAVSSVGDGVVNLVWNTPSTGYVDHYEVWRSTDGVAFAKLADAPSESYEDLSVTNDTTYYYKVKTVDDKGLAGLLSEAVSATPNVSGDSVAPSVPTLLTATADPGQPTVHLTWGASIDGGTPPSGLSGYVIERGSSATGPWTVLQSAYGDVFYDDIAAGWSATWYYRVRAVDLVGNASANATVGPVTTVPIVYRDITVTNNSGADVYVWVQNAAFLTWYATDGSELSTRPASGERVKKGKAVTWTSVPGGIYNVYYSATSTWPSTFLKTEAVNASAGNGTTSYP